MIVSVLRTDKPKFMKSLDRLYIVCSKTQCLQIIQFRQMFPYLDFRGYLNICNEHVSVEFHEPNLLIAQ